MFPPNATRLRRIGSGALVDDRHRWRITSGGPPKRCSRNGSLGMLAAEQKESKQKKSIFQFSKSLSLDLIFLDDCLPNRKVQSKTKNSVRPKPYGGRLADRRENCSLYIQFWITFRVEIFNWRTAEAEWSHRKKSGRAALTIPRTCEEAEKQQ